MTTPRTTLAKLKIIAAASAVASLAIPSGHAAPEYAPAPTPTESQPSAENSSSAASDAANTSVPLEPLPDANVLAKRMVDHQDIYAKIRDDALAAYAKQHPNPAPFDDEAHAALRLLAYLNVWGDYYGEGLWQQFGAHAKNLEGEDANVAVWTTQWRAHQFEKFITDDEPSAEEATHGAIDFSTAPYPALFKFRSLEMALQNLLSARTAHKIDSLDSAAFKEVPHLIDLAAQAYQQLIREHLPDDLLFDEGAGFLSVVSSDETLLDSVSTALDNAFAAAASGDPLAQVLKAEFHTTDAWRARGSGYAKSVSSRGWLGFHSHIDQAAQILDAVYTAHPNQPSVPLVMMKVVLDKPNSDAEMEEWFQRGLKLNADTFPLYRAKRWYLMPQWHGRGSERIVWEFGLSCVATNDWSHKTPLILLQADHDPVRRNPAFYAYGEIWTALERTFRDYLQRFPNSVEYRTFFLECAVKGGHWKVAAEQFALLGNHWDRAMLTGDAYTRLSHAITEHRDEAEAPSQPAPAFAPQDSQSAPPPSAPAPLPPQD